ncbi:hypothetical protein Nmel_007782 [Mimus melanotis]
MPECVAPLFIQTLQFLSLALWKWGICGECLPIFPQPLTAGLEA